MKDKTPEAVLEDAERWWSTSIIDIHPGEIDIRGYPIQELIGADQLPADDLVDGRAASFLLRVRPGFSKPRWSHRSTMAPMLRRSRFRGWQSLAAPN